MRSRSRRFAISTFDSHRIKVKMKAPKVSVVLGTADASGSRVGKVFPAEVIGPRGLAALVSVLPGNVALWPVGGIDPPTMGEWVAAGALDFNPRTGKLIPLVDVRDTR